MLYYITKAEMIEKWGKNYFGLTVHKVQGEADIYIQSTLPNPVQESVLAHEQYHAKGNRDELGAWIAGAKGNFKGFLLGIFFSLAPSRIKMYPEIFSAIALAAGFTALIYFTS